MSGREIQFITHSIRTRYIYIYKKNLTKIRYKDGAQLLIWHIFLASFLASGFMRPIEYVHHLFAVRGVLWAVLHTSLLWCFIWKKKMLSGLRYRERPLRGETERSDVYPGFQRCLDSTHHMTTVIVKTSLLSATLWQESALMSIYECKNDIYVALNRSVMKQSGVWTRRERRESHLASPAVAAPRGPDPTLPCYSVGPCWPPHLAHWNRSAHMAPLFPVPSPKI